MSTLLGLPHANVDVERIFFSVYLIKTRTRNRLQTRTVRAILKVKDGVKSSGGCVAFSPSSQLKQKLTSGVLTILYSTESTDDVCDSDYDN